MVWDSTDSNSEGVVPGTYTPPPLQKRRGRKYASLRRHETDVDDYFKCSDVWSQ